MIDYTNLAEIFQAIFAGIQVCLSCLTLPTIIISLYLLRRQTQDGVRATESSVYNNINSAMFEIDRFFFENPDLKPYFYEGKNIDVTDPAYPRVESVAEMLMDFIDNVFVLSKRIPSFPWESTWYKYFYDLFRSSPILRSYWKKHKIWYSSVEWYPKKFWTFVDNICKDEETKE